MADYGNPTRRFGLWLEAIERWLERLTLLRQFASIEKLRLPGWVWIVLIWFLFVVPAISLRAFHFEEGNIVALARGALEDGQWLAPSRYGYRFVERPVLMSWLVAGLGELFGINHGTARLPTILSLLAGALLIFHFLRQRTSSLAALFGVVCFFVSPVVLQRTFRAEPDLMLSVLLFAAFVLWWGGQAAGSVTLARWVTVGAVLIAAALTKGPQPIAYFTLGVGAFLLLYRRWRDVPGFLLANAMAGLVLLAWYAAVYQTGDLELWKGHSRLGFPANYSALIDWPRGVIEFVLRSVLIWLPALLLVVPGILTVVRDGVKKSDPLVMALLLYALCTTAVLAVWPIARSRYAMPAVLPIAALAGLLFERYRIQKPGLMNAALLIAVCLATYQLVLGWLVMPLAPDAFQKSRIAGHIANAMIKVQPATLYSLRGDAQHGGDLENNVLAYIPSRVREISLEELASLPAPAWVLVPVGSLAHVQALRPDLQVSPRAFLQAEHLFDLVEFRAK